eukprot:scaffold339308_cov15-Prasinocladus_malaysianus.AAC.1
MRWQRAFNVQYASFVKSSQQALAGHVDDSIPAVLLYAALKLLGRCSIFRSVTGITNGGKR